MRITWLVCSAALLSGAAAFTAGRPRIAAARRRAAAVAHAPRARVALSSAAAGSDGASKWYRTLGITPDASYDEITDAFAALVQQAGSDEGRIATLERARDMILDARLKMRLSGKGDTVRDPTIKPKRKRDWLAPLRFCAKYLEMPTREHVAKVTTLFGGCAITSLLAPSVGGQLSFLCLLLGPSTIYARGQPEPVRDDSGQIGEILPTKPIPWVLAFVLNSIFAGLGYVIGMLYLSFIIPPSVIPLNMLCNAMVAVGTWCATLVFKTQV